MDPSLAPQSTGRRLGQVVLAYLALAVAVVTLSPFRFLAEPVNGLAFAWQPFDVVMNVVMFVPLGFVHRISAQKDGPAALLGALAWGAALSGLIETAQVFAPDRFPSLVDLAANTAGAGLGSWLGALARRQADAASAVRAAAVELPLMGLVYLLAPLPWLIGVGSGGGARAWLVLPLAASAGWIIGSVLTSFDRASRSRVLLATAAWLFVALVPGVLASFDLVAAAAAAGLGTAWIRTVAPSRLTHEGEANRPPRRFEAATLRVVLPLLFAYLALSSLTPLSGLASTWRGTWALLPDDAGLGVAVIFRALEHLAGFTLIGYAIAEYHGRSRTRLRSALPVVLGWAGASSALLELARGWHASYGASATMFALTLVGAGLGGWIYALQLAHVRAVIGARPRAAADTPAGGAPRGSVV